jgi:hypothetical protein
VQGLELNVANNVPNNTSNIGCSITGQLSEKPKIKNALNNVDINVF